MFSRILCCPSEKVLQHPESNEAWKKRIEGIMTEKSYRDYDGIDGESTEFEWNIFPGFTTLQLFGKVSDLLSDLGQTPETFTGRILLCQCSMTSFFTKGNKDKCLANAETVKVLARRFGIGQCSSLYQILKRNGILQRIAHKEPGTTLQSNCGWNFQKVDILISVPRLHCPEAFSIAKDVENCRDTSLQIKIQLIQFIELFFLSISSVSAEQWQPYAKNFRAIKIDEGNLRF